MGSKKRILIGCPIHQKPHILELFLISLKRLSTKPYECSFLLIDDNVNPASKELLYAFENEVDLVTILQSDQQDNYICDGVTHQWNERLVWKVAELKNRMIDEARRREFDYLFLIDSDILLHSDTIMHLVKSDKEIISEIFWTKWHPDAVPQPQVWLKDEYTQWDQERGEKLSEEVIQHRYAEFIQRMNTPGTYQVGGLGACTLISKKAIQAGVNFNPIYNLSFWGEDRHFCIRAVALGFELYVDTTFPAFHIYRESDLDNGKDFLIRTNRKEDRSVEKQFHILKDRKPKITLSMIVKNESDRYLEKALKEHLCYIDQAVIIDDGSTDDTVEICLNTLKDIPVHLIENSISKFSNEIELRKQQWEETIKVGPEWILSLDADEIFEHRFKEEVHQLLKETNDEVISFRLYDFWNETHYREDQYWNAHKRYRPFLVKYNDQFNYTWKETSLHCGRIPENIFSLPNGISDLRLKHLGWMKLKDRIEKFHRYLNHDSEGSYGSLGQYLSILDEDPTLIRWEE